MEKVSNADVSALEESKEVGRIVNHEPRSRMQKQKKFGILKAMAVGVLLLSAVLGIAYIARAQTFRTKFFPNTYINGIDASYKTPDEIEEILRDEILRFQMTVRSRGNEAENLKGVDVGLRYVSDNSVSRILEEQDILTWFHHVNHASDYAVPTTAALDDAMFTMTVEGLAALDTSKFIAPENAKISEYIPGKGYEIVHEVQGNTLDIEKSKNYIKESVLTLKDEINLDTPDANVYIAPTIFAKDENLKSVTEQLNKLVNVSIQYSKGITLDGNTIHEWLYVDEAGVVELKDDLIKEYVKTTLAPSYDTAYKPKKLKTTGGGVVTITGGDYGWKVNQSAETGKIKELILAGESTQRDPEFSQRAASLGENDYGDSYVEVNLGAQKMFLYKDGNMILSSSFVSGNVARGWATPGGAYGVTYTQRNAVLNGENYSTPVAYWMPFNRGIGFHDAPWRGAFGGQIYRTSGSHGCINLPPSVAKTLFSHIGKGFPVLCHFGGGVVENTPEVAVQETAPVVTEAQTIAPGETMEPNNAVNTASEEVTQAKSDATIAAEPGSTAVISDEAPTAVNAESLQEPGGN